MRLVTIASLGVSAVLGLGALFVAKVALPNAASARSPGAVREVQGAPLVVASRAIKYGETLDAGMLSVIKVPASAVPVGAYTTIAAALASDRGGAPVTLVSLAQREAILPTKVSGPGARPSVSAEVADGMRAYAIKINDTTGVGGLALPGDRVDVVLMRDLTPDGPQRNYISYIVIQNARVLGVDLNADPTSNKPASPETATLEVSIEDSQKLSMASTLGTLSLALRRHGESQIADAAPLRTGDFLVGGGPRSTGAAARTAWRGPSRGYSAIVIIEGEPSRRGGGGRRSSASSAPAPAPAVNSAAGAATPSPGAAGLGAIG